MTTETYKFNIHSYSCIVTVEIGDNDLFKFYVEIINTQSGNSIKHESNWISLNLRINTESFDLFCHRNAIQERMIQIYSDLYYKYIIVGKKNLLYQQRIEYISYTFTLKELHITIDSKHNIFANEIYAQGTYQRLRGWEIFSHACVDPHQTIRFIKESGNITEQPYKCQISSTVHSFYTIEITKNIKQSNIMLNDSLINIIVEYLF